MLVLVSVAGAQDRDVTRYVDPFIGTEGGGHVFPGAALPFGMVKLGPDMGKNNTNSGYEVNGKINGFSHTHVSGTGGGAKYGNIMIMPFTGPATLNDISSPGSNDMATPGYYSVDLKRYGIRAKLTVTQHAGFQQYTFPESSNAHILIDAGHFLQSGVPYGEGQELVGSEVHVLSDHEIEGYSRVRGGWNEGGPYTVYFYAIFDTPADQFATWKNDHVVNGKRDEFDSGDKTGAVFTFHTKQGQKIRVKVGISYISMAKAYHYAEAELTTWDFNTVRKQASNKWEKELEKVSIETNNQVYKKMFYTALYHVLLMPTDKTGENPKWHSDEPYYDDYYAIWDTFRSSNPLLTLISPDRERDIVRSLIDIYKYDRYMPDSRSGDDNGRTQGGSNAEVLIADAFVKGLKGINYQTALKAMIKDAELPAGGNQRKQGRGGLHDYKTLGYVSTNYERSGTRTLEYAYDDFCLSEVAKGLGIDSLYRRYRKRADNWQHLWRPVTNEGVTGFIWPRNRDGSWQKDFTTLTAGSWPDFFYESQSWEYSLYVPQDVRGLIKKCGGKDAFINRLNTFFLKDGKTDSLIGHYYNVGNEPGFLTPALYIWAGRQDLTTDRVWAIIHKYFHDSRDGLPGNDDSGAMSSWLAFHMMGLYPLAGQDVYLVTAPHLKQTTIHLENGKTFVIKAEGLSPANRYVTSATLNGKNLSQAWFHHTDIKKGGTLILHMGAQPDGWGSENPPPSMSDK